MSEQHLIDKVRENTFILLYEIHFRQDDSINDIYDLAEESSEINLSHSVKEMTEGIMNNISFIDQVISKYSTKRDITRIAATNLSILRIAIYEILYLENVPVNAVVHQAVLLAQKYASNEDKSFINGLLSSFVKDRNQEQS